MSNRTYSNCPHGHRMFFDPDNVRRGSLRQWWCPQCQTPFKFTLQEKRLVMVAYNYGRKRAKTEIRTAIKQLLGIY